MVNQVTNFFKTLFKDTYVEKEASCIVGNIQSFSVDTMGINARPEFKKIHLTFWVEDKGNLERIFQRTQDENIVDAFNKLNKKHKLMIGLEEVK